jgi:hypothetical protein
MSPIEGLPDGVNQELDRLVEDVCFWVERENERVTPTEARQTIDELGKRALELALALDALHPTPRAHIVANLPADGFQQIKSRLAALHAAAVAGSRTIPPHRGNVAVGVPRYAADSVVAIFMRAQLPVTNSNSVTTLTMRALAAVLEAAEYRPILSPSAISKYVAEAKERAINPTTDEAIK